MSGRQTRDSGAARARRAVRVWLALAALLAAGALAAAIHLRRGAPPPALASAPAPIAPEFVGSDACVDCHRAEHDAWRGSQHARAMQRATAESLRGGFGGESFTYAGVRSTFFERDGRFFVRTDGPGGALADFEVKYTFGLEPLQQYLVELPGGRLQALSIAWDARPAARGGQRWFHLYPGEKVDHRDELHWTRRSQNWNHMCADCHSTHVRKGYQPATDRYATAWSEMTVGCEACHGPGSAHVAWARSTPQAGGAKGLTVMLDERRGITWRIDPATGAVARSRERPGDREIEVCAPCHSRRAQIAEGHRAGEPLLDHYLPSLLVPGPYHADGQQREEVYVWGSFLQSRMYREGVTCSDCHDPHTQKVRAEGNALCTRCHAASRYDGGQHHFHRPASAAGQCVSCHMPAADYMVVDLRRDHSLRVPRPDLSASLGVPHACTGCHRQRGARWAADAVRRWYGRDARGFQAFAQTFHGADAGTPGAASALAALASDGSQPAIVRSSALARLAGLAPPQAAAAALAGSRDPSPLVRLAAVAVAGSLPPRERLGVAGPLLADPLRAIRVEAAGALAGVALDRLAPKEREAWSRAAEDYVAAQRYAADRPEARTNLGTFFGRLGRPDDARAEFAAATRLDRTYVPAYVNAADACRESGREDEALRWLEDGLAAAPSSAALHHALGLARARRKEAAAALGSLERAARLEPDNARYAYVYAIALSSFGSAAEAIRTLERAARRWPADRDVLFALVTVRRDAGRLEAAREAARALVAAHPDDPEARALAEQLR
ncbi:MAG TPA: tetratricopeptide repeat protein [Anaeromyxobacteraceae bacterium]|nr:tetratricopeptide repeat protein [Anaeromyxobacteraceae bacterium]